MILSSLPPLAASFTTLGRELESPSNLFSRSFKKNFLDTLVLVYKFADLCVLQRHKVGLGAEKGINSDLKPL